MSLDYKETGSGISKSRKPQIFIDNHAGDSANINRIELEISVIGAESDGMLSLKVYGAAGGNPIYEKVINNEPMIVAGFPNKNYRFLITENAATSFTETDTNTGYFGDVKVNIDAFGPGSKVVMKYAGNSDTTVVMTGAVDLFGTKKMIATYGEDIGGKCEITYVFESDLAGS